jgi:hypothetical protein
MEKIKENLQSNKSSMKKLNKTEEKDIHNNQLLTKNKDNLEIKPILNLNQIQKANDSPDRIWTDREYNPRPIINNQNG